MAKVNSDKIRPKQYCIDCRYARDFHELKSGTKEPFLCKCDYQEWSQFLYVNNNCKNYKKKL